jgi:hypothetical protein
MKSYTDYYNLINTSETNLVRKWKSTIRYVASNPAVSPVYFLGKQL